MVNQNQRKYDLFSNTQVKVALDRVSNSAVNFPSRIYSMRFKLLIIRVIYNSCITSQYFYILGEENECGHRVRQI